MSKKKLEEVNQLHKKSEEAYKEYDKRVDELCRENQILLSKFSQWISNINNQRIGLRKEIKDLYEFLSSFGNIEEKVTLFDFVLEEELILENMKKKDSFKKDWGLYKTKWYNNGGLIGAIIIHNKNKRLITEKRSELDVMQMEWNKDIEERENYLDFCETAVEIANIYQNCVIIVKDAIEKQIIPELHGVRCFFYADAVREDILYNNEISSKNVRFNPYTEYKDTQYNKHYLFVKNTYDFYNTICKFFTRKILTDMFQDKTVIKERKEEIDEKVNEIKQQLVKVEENIMFVEGK